MKSRLCWDSGGLKPCSTAGATAGGRAALPPERPPSATSSSAATSSGPGAVVDESAEQRERDALLYHVQELLYELEAVLREMVVECPYPQLRIDLRQIMMDLGETRQEARRRTTWFAKVAQLPRDS